MAGAEFRREFRREGLWWDQESGQFHLVSLKARLSWPGGAGGVPCSILCMQARLY